MNPSGLKFSFPWRSKGKAKGPTASGQSPESSKAGLRPFGPSGAIPDPLRWRRVLLGNDFKRAIEEKGKGKGKAKASSGTEDVSRPLSLRKGIANPPPTGPSDTKTTQQGSTLYNNTEKKPSQGGDMSGDAGQSSSAPFQPRTSTHEEGSRAGSAIPSHDKSESLLEMHSNNYTYLLSTDESQSAHSLSLQALENLISQKGNIIQALVDGSLKINNGVIKGGSALCLVAEKGTPDTIDALLMLGADVNHVMTTGNIGSALVAACLRKQEANVQFLIQRGADVNMRLVCGEYGTALAAVSAQGDFTIAYNLLHAGAKINMAITSGRFGSALAAACHHNGTEMVKFLIDRGASIHGRLFHGEFENSLVAAISGKNKENVKVLLERGANPDITLQSGNFGDAISLAIHLKDKISINTLIEHRAKIGPLAADLIDLGNFRSSLLPDDHTVAHASSPPRGKVFSTHFKCELPELARDCQNLHSWLFKMTVLVRKEDTIEYSTIGQFLSTGYDKCGSRFLNRLCRAFDSKGRFYVDGEMSIQIQSDTISLETCSLNKDLPSIFEWFCLSLRRQTPGVTTLSGADKETKAWTSCMSLRPLQSLPDIDLQTGCWRELFDGALVAPAPGVQYQAPCRGLELCWKTMIQLAAVEYPVLVKSGAIPRSGLVFLGYSTALIPIRVINDEMILWHLEVASHNRQIKTSELQATQSEWLRTKDLLFLTSRKALLGWCSQADLRLGASTDDLNVTWSSAKRKPFSWEIANINLQTLAQSASLAQLSIQASVSWKLVNNTIKFSPSGEYLKCLNGSMLEQIVLYDVGTMRAWLVPLISVFHHMLLVYWKRIPKKFRGKYVPVTSTASLHPDASYDALVGMGEIVIQKTEEERNNLTVQKLIIGFSINLGKILHKNPKGKKIYGYEFMDIVCEPQTTTLRKTSLKKDSLAWLPLLNEIDCLFCSHLGDAIVAQRTPDCSSPCNILPHRHDLLAALIQSIRHLSETNGGSSEQHVRRLLNDGGWQLTGSPFQACQHDSHGSCWNQPEFLQRITPIRSHGNSESSSLQDHVNGAVVFGGQVKTPWFSFFSRASGQYQNGQATISVPIRQEQVENTTHVLVQSN